MHSDFSCQLKYAEDDVTTAEGDRDQLSPTTTVCRHDGTELLYTKKIMVKHLPSRADKIIGGEIFQRPLAEISFTLCHRGCAGLRSTSLNRLICNMSNVST